MRSVNYNTSVCFSVDSGDELTARRGFNSIAKFHKLALLFHYYNFCLGGVIRRVHFTKIGIWLHSLKIRGLVSTASDIK